MNKLGEQKHDEWRKPKEKKQNRKKRTGLITAIFLVAVFLFVIGGTAFGGYSTTQITDDSYDLYGSAINAGGQVAWSGYNFNDGKGGTFLYSGGVTTQLINDYWGGAPQINGAGQVVWLGWGGEIFLYSDGDTIQLSSNGNSPQINDGGEVVWQGKGIFLYTPGSGIVLLSSNGSSPQINDSGQVVWRGYTGSGSDLEIFLYSGGATTQLTNNSYNDWDPQINGSGQVVWQGDGGIDGGNDSEIFLYSGGATTQLTSNGYRDYFPQINDSGQVVWQRFNTYYDGTDSEIFLYSGGATTQLSVNDNDDSNPQINTSGQVVWWGYGGADSGSDSEIFLYSGDVTTQLTSNGEYDMYPQINDSGQVVWQGSDGYDYEVFLATSCTEVKPSLTLSRTKVYWASYADYQASALSVDYNVENTGSDPAQDVQITGSTATNGVTLLTAMPSSVGDLGGSSGATSTLKYNVPPGVASFRASVNVGSKDACGNGYTYP